jgi:hypothetical protein
MNKRFVLLALFFSMSEVKMSKIRLFYDEKGKNKKV